MDQQTGESRFAVLFVSVVVWCLNAAVDRRPNTSASVHRSRVTTATFAAAARCSWKARQATNPTAAASSAGANANAYALAALCVLIRCIGVLLQKGTVGKTSGPLGKAFKKEKAKAKGGMLEELMASGALAFC